MLNLGWAYEILLIALMRKLESDRRPIEMHSPTSIRADDCDMICADSPLSKTEEKNASAQLEKGRAASSVLPDEEKVDE